MYRGDVFLSKGVQTAHTDTKPHALGQRSKEPKKATASEGRAGVKAWQILRGHSADPLQRGKQPAAGKEFVYRNSPWTKGEPAT